MIAWVLAGDPGREPFMEEGELAGQAFEVQVTAKVKSVGWTNLSCKAQYIIILCCVGPLDRTRGAQGMITHELRCGNNSCQLAIP